MAAYFIQNDHTVNLKLGNNLYVCTLDGNRCKDSRSLLNEIAAIFRFPTYFGNNYDGLHDCLTDLEWLGVDNIYLLVNHPNLICSNEDVLTASHPFVRVLKSVMESFINHPMHFHLVAEKSFLHLINPELK
jgi:RNAse (barnase) inhibitor barstar